MKSLAVGDTLFHLLATVLVDHLTSGNSTTGTTVINATTQGPNFTTSASQIDEVNPASLIEQLQPYVIMSGVALLFLLLVCNFISVLQRKKYHRVIQRDFLTLHALLPLLRNYDDIDGPRRYAKGRNMSKDPTIEEYDEIGMFIRGSKMECKRNSSVRNSLKTPDRNTVYSLQKEVLSTDF